MGGLPQGTHTIPPDLEIVAEVWTILITMFLLECEEKSIIYTASRKVVNWRTSFESGFSCAILSAESTIGDGDERSRQSVKTRLL
jgi:hypothetical protein